MPVLNILWPFGRGAERQEPPPNASQNGHSPDGPTPLPTVIPDHLADAGTAPIVSASVGTTGLKRSWMYYEMMKQMGSSPDDKLGCSTRIQSMLTYDCNNLQLDWLSGRVKEHADVDGRIIKPRYLPFSEGFLRRPDQYLRHYGAIERDMEEMVAKAQELSTQSGTDPQVILLWAGFGGHTMLTFMMRDLVYDYFPESAVLPVVSFPDERSMLRNIRDKDIWHKFLEVFTYENDDGSHNRPPILLTDNRRSVSSSYQRLDQLVVGSLAAVESGFKLDPSSSSLAEVVSEFRNNDNRWIVAEHAEFPINIHTEQGAPPAESVEVAKGKIAQGIKDVILRIANPQNTYSKSAFFTPRGRNSDISKDADQRIYVVMPYGEDHIRDIEQNISDQLNREQFRRQFPGTRVAYGKNETAGEFRNKIHIYKLVGLQADPTPLSISTILNDDLIPETYLQRERSDFYAPYGDPGRYVVNNWAEDDQEGDGAADGDPRDPTGGQSTGSAADESSPGDDAGDPANKQSGANQEDERTPPNAGENNEPAQPEGSPDTGDATANVTAESVNANTNGGDGTPVASDEPTPEETAPEDDDPAGGETRVETV